ncbi:hypothetical protein KFK09_015522 [Dendrobium nobile]|uniref:HMA domain-containing protein n=1 Tax=Dendrobium nobile TaxID=94219 RepID=A0A8T3B507_DENNO|nr:hypothetical protein KFK09_015522 [Dendrobium nobile]
MSKKIEISAEISGSKSQKNIMMSIAKFEGINSIIIGPKKNLITIIGTADPVKILKDIRKLKILAELVSVGPESEEEEEEENEMKIVNNPCCVM